MDFATITCPRCHTRMTVVRSASPRLICPRCLGVVDNPAPRASIAPVPVLPLETQHHRDQRNSCIVISVLIVTIPIGVVIAHVRAAQVSGSAIFVLAIALVLGWSLLALAKGRSQSTVGASEHEKRDAPTDPAAATVRVLGYARPRPVRTSNYPEQTSISAAIGGFFVGLFVCVASTVLLVTHLGSRNAAYPILVFAAIVILVAFAAYLGSKPGFRGFTPAVIAGLTIGMIALAPVGRCYLSI